MTYRFTYFEHIGFADIASPDYLLMDGEEYLIYYEIDEYLGYRGSPRKFPYIHGNFFRRYNSDHEEMRIELSEKRKDIERILEKTEIRWKRL